MLIEFSVSNFRSFKNKVILSMFSKRNKELIEQTFDLNKNIKLLKSIVIYGSNSGGKSNLLTAFSYLEYLILKSFNSDGEKVIKNEYYLFDEKFKKIPTEFVIDFYQNNIYFRYSLSTLNKKVYYECLEVKEKNKKNIKLFERNQQKFNISKDFEFAQKYSEDVAEDVLLVSNIFRTENNYIKNFKEWFLKLEMLNYGDTFYEIFQNKVNIKKIKNDATYKKELLSFLKGADEEIIDLSFKTITHLDEEGNEEKEDVLVYSHKLENSQDKLLEVSIQKLSDGTQKILKLFDNLYSLKEKGGILFVDELDAKLHPLLVEKVVEYVQNHKNSQLIITLHNHYLLDNQKFRRDAIYFVKKINGTSKLKTLYDLKDKNGNRVRNDALYHKEYLDKKYDKYFENE